MKTIRKTAALVLALTMLLCLLAGCGSKSYSESADMPYAPEVNDYYSRDDMAEKDYDTGVAADAGKTPPENRKWIVTVDLSAETEDLTALLDQLTEQIAKAEGYTERQSISGYSNYYDYRTRSADLTIRVPADRVDSFLEGVSSISNVTSNQKSLQDVTLTYVATESRVHALETEESRLLELLEKAESLSDILAIEDRLTDVRYELESVASSLKVLANQVDYATVNLYVREVKVYTPVAERTLWERITGGFKNNLADVGEFLEDFLVWALTNIPTFLLIAVVAVPVCILLRRRHRRKKEAKARKAQEQE